MLTVPIVFMVMLIAVQAAVFMHTAHIAQMSATEGVSAAAQFGGGIPAGAQATFRSIAELGAHASDIPKVTISEGVAEVEVTLRVPRVTPFFDLLVTRSAREPVERYLTPDER